MAAHEKGYLLRFYIRKTKKRNISRRRPRKGKSNCTEKRKDACATNSTIGLRKNAASGEKKNHLPGFHIPLFGTIITFNKKNDLRWERREVRRVSFKPIKLSGMNTLPSDSEREEANQT